MRGPNPSLWLASGFGSHGNRNASREVRGKIEGAEAGLAISSGIVSGRRQNARCYGDLSIDVRALGFEIHSA
jgi:hypothetical protein